MGARVRVHVTPKSKRSEVAGYDEWKKAIIVRVRAPPEGGKANREVEQLLSEFFGTSVEIVSGHRSRDKVVEIKGMSEEEVYAWVKGV
ncbi:TIGR00251 family protein [Geoglobus ahangari]|uniref:UPF0235 protein GAH_00692 n=1 Tax=Geoglobus ahangari TaxID=113653 RepID=A0A0F7IFP6_9EURY|nr:DUF167 domain-containing protein [Geoglobus ahangari]AKG91972.1 TIGR00251 family protein [Geoglobus ahangari]